jgi:general secretion pathway protein E
MEEWSAAHLLQQMLMDALDRGCTDVHLHSIHDALVVQFRISGQMQQYLRTEQTGQAVIRRIKALARMDVAETRLPQDGSFCWQSETQNCDIRVASVPTVHGEAVVLRLLPHQRGPVTFTSLGMTQSQSDSLDVILQSNNGMVLVAGPTGSGKTTTLYAMMLQLARWGRHVVSIEDPVEMPVPDCHQIEVREHIGVTFQTGLRALLRQDPDVIMIGEIRDEDSARVALRATLSGHMVLSTTHARDLVGAAARLVEFGLPRPLVGDVLRAVIVQEMGSQPCRQCHGQGCARCQESGIDRERIVRFELHESTPELASLIASDIAWGEVRQRCKQQKRLRVHVT